MAKLFPDAIVRDGVIRCTNTDVELPSYEGLCLANLATHLYVMYTWFNDKHERQWCIVHEGGVLDMKAVEDFFSGKTR